MLESNSITAIETCEAALVALFGAMVDNTGKKSFALVSTKPGDVETDQLPSAIVYDKYSALDQGIQTFEITIRAEAEDVSTNRGLLKSFFEYIESLGYDKIYLGDARYPARVTTFFHTPESSETADTEKKFASIITIEVDLKNR